MPRVTVKQNEGSFSEPLQQVDRTYLLWRGRRLSYFGGCDYFRLSSDPRVQRAVVDGLATYGLNVAASRRTTGNHPLYLTLEREIARFFGAPRAALVSNGYLTNIVAAQGLRGRVAQILLDERSHSSLRDAAKILDCRVTTFRHRDYEDAAKRFERLKSKAGVALLTDGLFAQDGTLAPVREYRQALGAEVLLWVDDSHAGGVMGARGQGSLSQAGLKRHNVIQTVTFSKAFGVYGGAVLCDEATFRGIVANSSALTGNTPLPLPLAAGVSEALRIVRSSPQLRQKLRKNIEWFWRALGVHGVESMAPIVSLAPADPTRLRRELLRHEVYPSFITYPGGPEAGYYRFAISSEHTRDQISRLAAALGEAELL